MDRLKLIIAYLLFINSIVALAQTNSLQQKSNENCLLHTNATCFVNGEQLLYVVNCIPTNSSQELTSKVVYVELIDSQKNSVFKHKIFTTNGKGNGYFTIPTNLQTGNYKLLAYTFRMFHSNEAEIESIAITIINPYVVSTNEFVKTNDSPTKPILNTLATEVITAKKEFLNRETITFDFKKLLTDLKATSFSVSIRKKDEIDNLFQGNETTSKSLLKIVSAEKVVSELRGEIISGKISAKKESFSVENKNINLSIPGYNNSTKISKTNKNGEFYFLLEKAFYSNNFIIQCIDEDKENYKVSLFKNEIDLSSITINPEITIPVSLKNAIENRLITTQIENSYYEMKQDSLKKININTPFYKTHSKEYQLDKYTRFSTLQETIIEVIDGLTLKKKKENYQLYLKDYDENTDLEVPSLVLVDGLYIQDIKELLNHKAEIFTKISIVKGGYVYGSKLYNGIIELTTKEYNYETKLHDDYIIRPELLRPLPEKTFYNPKYDLSSNLSKIPDYRYQLYWEPHYTDDTKPITFTTSDIDGVFEIKIEGFNSENEYFKRSQFFEVK